MARPRVVTASPMGRHKDRRADIGSTLDDKAPAVAQGGARNGGFFTDRLSNLLAQIFILQKRDEQPRA